MPVMGDATHAQVAQLAAIRGGLALVAGYDSGSPDIDWTPDDWALFPGLPQVRIDQAFNTTINTQAHVVVFDVEPGAYQPAQAGALIAVNQTPRPTVYVNQSNILATVRSALLAPNWRGDTWVAIPGWQPGAPLPAVVNQAVSLGAVVVAVQNDFRNPAYDLSEVLDPTWPKEQNMPASDIIRDAGTGAAYLLSGGKMHHIGAPADLNSYTASGYQITNVSSDEITALLTDFPPGHPAAGGGSAPANFSFTGSGTVS